MRTGEVAALLGISYRRVDYLDRKLTGLSAGQGYYREWDADVVDRLVVAVTLLREVLDVAAIASGHLWLALAEACLAGPVPPRDGWATYRRSTGVVYGTAAAMNGGLSALYRLPRRDGP